MHELLLDVSPSISWGDLARRYFTKSAPWFYQRLNGRDGNGAVCAFKPEERARLAFALRDLAGRLTEAALRVEAAG